MSHGDINGPLLKLFARTPGARWGALIAFVVAFGLMTFHVVSQSLTLSGEQKADGQLGVYEIASQAVPTVPLGTRPPSERVQEILQMHGAERVDSELLVNPLQGDARVVDAGYVESDFVGLSFPARFTLLEGSWPTEPGQACVSPSLRETLAPGTRIDFYGGALPLTINCVVEDQYSTDSDWFYAAPGTWARSADQISAEDAARWDTEATLTVLWSGGDLIGGSEALMVEFLGQEMLDAEYGVDGGPVLLRDTLVHDHRGMNVLSNPWIYLVPVILVPILGALISTWASGRLLSRSMTTLHALGLRRNHLRVLTVLLPLMMVLTGTLIGVMTGWLTGGLVRAVLESALTRPLGPVTATGQLVGMIVLGSVVGIGMGSTLPLVKAGSAGKTDNSWMWAAKIPWPSTPFVVGFAVLAVAGALFLMQDGSSQTAMVGAVLLWGTSLVILLPVMIRWLSGRRTGSPTIMLAGRQVMMASGTWLIAIVFGVQALLATGGLTAMTSAVGTFNDQQVSTTPPDQARLFVHDTAAPGIAPQIIGEITDDIQASTPLEYWQLDLNTSVGDGAVYALSSVADVTRFAGVDSLAPEVATALQDGAVLRAQPAGGTTLDLLGEEDGSGTQKTLARLPIVVLESLDPSMQATGGVVLTSTAEEAGVLDNALAGVAFTELSSEQLQALSTAPDRLGFSDSWLLLPRPPDVFPVPAPVVTGSAILVGVGIIIALVYAAQSTAGMRPLVAGLRSLGLRRSWSRSVVVLQLCLVIVLPTVVGAAAGIMGFLVTVAVSGQPFELHVPWGLLSLLIGGAAVSFAVGALFSQGRLRPAERIG